MKKILANKSDLKGKKSPKKVKKETFYDSIKVKDKSYISKKQFDEEFRGWGFGFTFFQ